MGNQMKNALMCKLWLRKIYICIYVHTMQYLLIIASKMQLNVSTCDGISSSSSQVHAQVAQVA